MAKPVLGIDFGMSNTSAAWIDDEARVRAIPMRDDGSFSMPTVVWYDGKGNVLVGQSAKEMALADPQNTIYGFKRFIGRRYASDFVHRLKDRLPYRIVAGPDGDVAFESHGRVRPISETTFHVINRVLELAQAQLTTLGSRDSFEECVLTVPAHASFRQRRALRLSAEELVRYRVMAERARQDETDRKGNGDPGNGGQGSGRAAVRHEETPVI